MYWCPPLACVPRVLLVTHAQRLPRHSRIVVSGKLNYTWPATQSRPWPRIRISHPQFMQPLSSLVAQETLTRLVDPVYRCTKGVTSTMIYSLQRHALRHVQHHTQNLPPLEWLEDEFRREKGWPLFLDAVADAHLIARGANQVQDAVWGHNVNKAREHTHDTRCGM